MLEQIVYCPILHTRQAEIKALIQLPLVSKQKIFPLIVARPWPNAKGMVRTWEKVAEAFGAYNFALDLDTSRYDQGTGKAASDEFRLLFNPANGFSNYYDAIAALPRAVPVLRLNGGSIPEIDKQATHVDLMDRGVVCRLQYMPGVPVGMVVREIIHRFPDLTIFVDTGWSPDLLMREAWASQIIQQITDEKPETEIVVTGSSFPDTFSDIGARGIRDLKERTLFANLMRRHNAATLVYGDWGSTRPTPEPSVMRITPRIDLPTRANWIFFRQDKSLATPESYADIAKRTMDDANWPRSLAIWGTYTIECTAQDVPGGIRSPAAAAAARVNIHLHQQAFYSADDVVSDSDEPYTDD